MDSKIHMIIVGIGIAVIILAMLFIGPMLLNMAQQALPALAQGIGIATDSAGKILSQSSEIYKSVLSSTSTMLSSSIATAGSLMANGITTCNGALGAGMSAANTVASSGVGVMSTAGGTALKSIGDVTSGVSQMMTGAAGVTSSSIGAGFDALKHVSGHVSGLSQHMTEASKSLGTVAGHVLESASSVSGGAVAISNGLNQFMTVMASGASSIVAVAAALPVNVLAAGVSMAARYLASPIKLALDAVALINSTLSTIGGYIHDIVSFTGISDAIGTVSSVLTNIQGLINDLLTPIQEIASIFTGRGIGEFVVNQLVNNFSAISSKIEDSIKYIIEHLGCQLIGIEILGTSVCHLSSAEINTENGWIQLKDLKVGQRVITNSGSLEIVKYIVKNKVANSILYDYTTGSHPMSINGEIRNYVEAKGMLYLGAKVMDPIEGTVIRTVSDADLVTIELEGPEHTYECRLEGYPNRKFRDISIVEEKSRSAMILMAKFLDKYDGKLNDLTTGEKLAEVMTKLTNALSKSIDCESLSLEDAVNITAYYNTNIEKIKDTLNFRFRSDTMYILFYMLFNVFYMYGNCISFTNLQVIDFNIDF